MKPITIYIIVTVDKSDGIIIYDAYTDLERVERKVKLLESTDLYKTVTYFERQVIEGT